MKPTVTHFDRRHFLGGVSALAGFGLLGSSPAARMRRLLAERGAGAKNLVILILDGGNDGLSTIVPYGDDIYQRSRAATRHETSALLELDDYRAFHPNLGGMHALFEAGQLAVIEGTGYPTPNRSHFSSMDIWQAARKEGKLAGEGWVSRLLQTLHGEDVHPNRTIHIGGKVPFMLRSPVHPAVCFDKPKGYRLGEHESEIETMAESTGDQTDSPQLAFMRTVLRDANASSAEVLKAVDEYETPVEYPDDELAQNLRTIAALLHGGIGAQILSTQLIGFDTHANQKDTHDRLMRSLDISLTPLMQDLQRSEVGRETVVLIFSEFGRRVVENGSVGTDHGVAGPMFLVGNNVSGGLYGKHPSLSELTEGDLIHNTDFRSVYASLIQGHFGADPTGIVGGEYPTLPLLKS